MMKIVKTKTHALEKCYSIAPLRYQNKDHILVAAEKINKCLLFDLQGNLVDTIWEQPGGTMSMVQVPNSNGQFLATHKFYSPNDSKEAKIVVVTPQEDGSWDVKTLVDLPHVHRFDILERDGQAYLFAATLCSGRDFKDDWAHKGKVYAAKLPENLALYNENNQLPLTVLKDELLKNHGYYRGTENGYDYAVVGTEDGIYKFVPPAEDAFEAEQLIDKAEETLEFTCTQLLATPASDMALVDLTGDGNLELVVFSPFHGAKVDVYALQNAGYTHVYAYDQSFDFSHAIWSGEIAGQKIALLGNREGTRHLMGLTYENGAYTTQIFDQNVGVANTLAYKNGEMDCIVSANREINEIAFYQVMA